MAKEIKDQDALWLGIDLGTTSVKIVLTNTSGNVISSKSCLTEAQVTSNIGNNGFEQSPKRIFQAVEDVLLSVIATKTDKIKGIGITGQMHGVVLWGQNMKESNLPESIVEACDPHCSNLYTWQDQRCTPEFLASIPVPNNQFQTLSTGYGCSTIFWLLRNQPTFFSGSNFTSCGTIMDYLVTLLCGLAHTVTSDQLAASLGYYNPRTLAWDSVLYEGQEFPCNMLPKIVLAGSKVGHVRASLKGWPQNVPVFVGMGDVQCGMYAVLETAQDAAINISTSIQLGFIVPSRDAENVWEVSPPCLSFFPYFEGCYLALCAGLNGGNAIYHFVNCMAHWIQDLGLVETVAVNPLLAKLYELAEAAVCKMENSYLKVMPVYFGERHDPSLSGHISGLTATNFRSIGLIFKSVCEGVVDHLHSMVSAEYLLKQGINRLLVSGSVPVKNRFVWQRLSELYTVADMLELVLDAEGADAAGSAVGAAKIVQKFGCN